MLGSRKAKGRQGRRACPGVVLEEPGLVPQQLGHGVGVLGGDGAKGAQGSAGAPRDFLVLGSARAALRLAAAGPKTAGALQDPCHGGSFALFEEL